MKRLIDLLPNLSAKDLFCHKCCKQISYKVENNIDIDRVSFVFWCHDKEMAIHISKIDVADNPEFMLDKSLVLATLDSIRD